MARMVTCVYCNKLFDRDKEAFTQISARRYAHAKCVSEHQKNISKQEQDYNNLIEYIKKLYKVPAVLPTVIKQIKEFKQQYGFTYTGIQKSLYWFYELKGNPISKANNQLGIIPYIYNDACNYFYHLYLGQIASEKEIEMPSLRKILIQSPECVPEMLKTKMFDLEENIDE